MRITILVLMGVVLAAPSQAAHLNLFLAIGQSNMFGADALVNPAAGTTDMVDEGLQTTADQAALFTMNHPTLSYAWGDIRGHNTMSFGQLTTGGLPYKGIGPEVGFNRALYDAGWRDIAIIKYGANFSALESGRSPWVSPGTLWTTLTGIIDARLSELTALGHTWTLRGIVWHQGIDNAVVGQSQAGYETDMRQIVSDLRDDYGSPDTPFVLARSIFSPFPASANMTAIRAAEVVIGDEYNGWVDTDDQSPYVNSHHMYYASHLIVGDRFGQLMSAAIGPPYTNHLGFAASDTATGPRIGNTGKRLVTVDDTDPNASRVKMRRGGEEKRLRGY